MQASSLGWYLHEQPAPLLETKRKRKQFKRIPVTTRGTHARTPAWGGNIERESNVHVCEQQGQTDQDIKRARGRTKVYVVAMKGSQVTRSKQSTPPHCRRPEAWV